MNYNKIVSDWQEPRRSLFLSIRTKLIATFCLLFVVVMVIVLLVSLRGLPFTDHAGTQGFQRAETFRNLILVADLKKERLLRWMEERIDDAEVASSSDMMLENVTLLRAAIREFTAGGKVNGELWDLVREEKSYRNLLSYINVFRAAYGVYQKIYIADAETGKIIVSSDDTYLNSDISHTSHFTEGLFSRTTFMTDIGFDPLDNFANFHISHTIADRDGKVSAVWVMQVDPEDIIRPMLHTRDGLGETGEVLLVNRDVRILTSLRHPLPDGTRAKPLEYRINARPAVFASKGEEGIIEAEDYRGEPVLAAYRHLRVAPEFGWGMVVKRDKAEIFAPLRRNIFYSVFIGLSGIFIAVVFIIILTSGLIRPILSLSRTADKIADGDLGARTAVTTSDEVGHLAITFNSMIQRLEEWHKNLDNQVNARTDELKKTNKKLSKKIAEHEHAEKALRESEERFRAIFEQAAVGVAQIDSNTGQFFRVNKRYCDIVGYTPDEMTATTFMKITHPDDLQADLDNVDRLRAGKIQEFAYEKRYFHKNGSIVWVNLAASLMWHIDEKPRYHVTVAEDITERKQAEEERKKMETQLQQAQKMEAIGTLAGGIAHNFNNLLMGIMGNASIVLLDLDPIHPHYQSLKNIEKNVQSGSKLTRQLLGYARGGRYEVKPLSLNQLVKETSDTFDTTRKEIRVHRELGEDLFGIKADQGQIEQVLLNLYVNAADAMPGGGELYLKTMNVTDKGMKDKPFEPKPGNYVFLTVRDTGVGIDREAMERIFEPFFTTKGLAESTGLGLASSYGIIKAHGGYIDVESEKGHGTTFSIYLPATEEEVEEKKELSDELLMGKGTILLVDDEEMVLNVGERILKKLGYEVLSASSCQEALDLYKKNQDNIDMVLLDMVMPDMGGGKTYDRMKEINPKVKVLLSSGYSIDGQATEILEQGCDAFIQKPFNLNELSQRIREILDRK